LRDEPWLRTSPIFAPADGWGGDENRNGVIRRYSPERCEIRMGMTKEVRKIVDEADNRPMRVPGYRTSAEVFAGELSELQDQQGRRASK